jgi:superfamily I DNA/RNA helicase
MNNLELILGPPGTGKTTALLDLVDAQLQAGVNPARVGFISFTKRAVEEAASRAMVRFKLTRRQLPFFRTFHSLAFLQLGLRASEVMQGSHYRALGQEVGMSMSGYARHDLMTYELSTGDQIIFIESLSRLSCKSLEETWANQQSDITWLELQYVVSAIIKYKQAHLLTDYTDMLTRYYTEGVAPQLDLLIVDEAQDLCQLQWDILERLSLATPRVVAAGDDDQAIFRWSGAAVDHFAQRARTTEKVRILGQSYRVPIGVQKLSNKLIGGIKDRREKPYLPTSEPGVIDWVRSLEDLDLSKGDWLILVRNNYLIQPVVEHLRLCGYPYKDPKGDVRQTPGVRAALAWEKLRLGQDLDKTERFFVNKYLPRNLPANLENVDPDKKKLPWYEVLNLPTEEREYYKAARRAGESFVKPPRLMVSTIHGAKGGECDQVALFLDMSARSYEGYQQHPDDETRVFYVALTRARRRLVLVMPQTNNFFNLETR